MELSSRYVAGEIEDKWYKHWKDSGYFKSTPDDREPYSIVIPPPNVTGILHMGHMLNNTVQDVLARKARMDGKNVCWVPGTDHASIATEAKVVRWLREEKGLTKSAIGREKYMEYAWEWTHKYGGIILKQLQRLGASCDWDRTSFTMDEVRSKQVYRAFVDLYNRGKLYRDWRMVHWDPRARTVLSNEEVLYREENTFLYHVKYHLVDDLSQSITIATTRPETILGDTAIAVHPEDDRYRDLVGKLVKVPLINREIPIIADDYVDREFGSGALKITPAHDANDYEIGKRHDLKVVDVITDDGHMSEAAEHFIGEDIMTARKHMIEHLESNGQLVQKEPLVHSVGRSERTDAVVEPRLSLQWYVKMDTLAKPALESVMSDEIEFFPKNQKNTYRHWMTNIRDWCISRQLWWGHRIPAYYYEDEVFVAETPEEALEAAREKTGIATLTMADLRQDEDVLDTWFSSWLWPFSVFDGMDEGGEIDYYYPTSVLVTAWDIIFLWVARMAMAGFEWKGEKPFRHVYFTGMVRDPLGRKMSKSLGNSPDALELLDNYGADGVRFGILSSSPAGGDLLFDEKLCEQGRNFCNKIWNALRLVKGWETSDQPSSDADKIAFAWIEEKLQTVIEGIENDFQEYRLSESLTKLYSFIWTDFCSWYLEMVKPAHGDTMSLETYNNTTALFSKLMQLLHPFMPFVTEEVWHQLSEKDGDCMMSYYPKKASLGSNVLEDVEYLKEIIAKVRDVRNKNGLKVRELLPLKMLKSARTQSLLSQKGWSDLLQSTAFLEGIQPIDEASKDVSDVAFVVGTDKFYITISKEVDVEEELKTVEADLEYQRGFVKSIEKKLSNERFVNNAPEAVVDKERKKLADGQKRIAMLEETLVRLKG